MFDERMFEQIGGVLCMPGQDLPFGKVIRMGGHEVTIYERIIEQGYLDGVRAHWQHIEDGGEMEALTDSQFTTVMNRLIPWGLAPEKADTWRAHFIVGWTCVHLGIADPDQLT